MTMAKTEFDATEGPGLARLGAAKQAEAIRQATLADQRRARAEVSAAAASNNRPFSPRCGASLPSKSPR
jgi:hypothetical protein